MYKAILVDDEKIVRLALKTIVDWTALGYRDRQLQQCQDGSAGDRG